MDQFEKVKKISFELTYHWYLLNRGKIKTLFNELSISEYIALHVVLKKSKETENGKLYLRELAEGLEMSTARASKTAGKLKEKGLVNWTHDGDGNEGTYITLTESGKSAISEQDKTLADYYGRIIDYVGIEKAAGIAQRMMNLDKHMKRDLEGDEDTDNPEDQ